MTDQGALSVARRLRNQRQREIPPIIQPPVLLPAAENIIRRRGPVEFGTDDRINPVLDLHGLFSTLSICSLHSEASGRQDGAGGAGR